MKRFSQLYLIFLMIGLAACSQGNRQQRPLPTRLAPAAITVTRPPTPPITPSPTIWLPPTATPVPTPTPAPITLSAGPTVPQELITQARQIAATYPAQFTWVESETADLTLTANGRHLLAEWVYVAAAPFPTVADNISLNALQTGWQTGQPNPFQLLLGEETAVSLPALGGNPGATIPRHPQIDVVERLWASRPALTIIPFHHLQPRLKVLTIDGQSPLNADFDPEQYPLILRVGLEGPETAVSQFLGHWAAPRHNFESAKLTTVAMTGVTALVRATAYQMELNGVSYPGTAVADVLTAAAITHVSNEVAFAPDCPYPDYSGGTTFCSREKYFTLLEDIGVDVVELTGNHVNDWGRDNFVYSLDLYEAADMATFGGGRNSENAAQPAVFAHNGNQIAFVGCNPVGPAYAWAEAGLAGSRPCADGFYEQISQLEAAGYLVIATLQYQEHYFYQATGQQVVDFQRVADAGATAVSGSQGHHAQGFAFHEGAFIHYGLGNLFFDQMDRLGTRQTFVDTYFIYDNQLLSVQLWTGLIENWARPRLMTPAERENLLGTVFQASGW